MAVLPLDDVLEQVGQPPAAGDSGDVGDPAKLPLPVDISLSADDSTLFVDSFMDGTVRVYDVTNPRKPRAVKAREHVAAWVRSLGVDDPELQPNHAWRHTFKQVAHRHGISEHISDCITGHSPATVGRGYGAPTLGDMAAALKRFPRYEV